MKKNTTHAAAAPPRTDASLDRDLNPVRLANGTVVSWATAFPRP
jgi:hypothetical protein